MKLTTDQITTLKKLISYKGYPEIDLQYEILDHVACKVEVMLEENPKLSLDDAFRKVHSEFGIFGFSDLAESYTKSIERRYRGFFWEEFKKPFTTYRIVFPVGIAFILYWLSMYTRPFGYELTFPIWAVIFFFVGLIFIIINYHKEQKRYKNYVAFRSTNNFLLFLNFFIQPNFFALRYLDTSVFTFEFTPEGIFMSIALLTILLSFLSTFFIPRVLQRSIAETKKLQVIYKG
ncbi:MAG: hypothetical protein P8O16_14955 [Algoriphagus sp.]|uniref:hypothetical protein n=1 Tax=Algoriphagus sp. TaxID=1872435 RepID=UPI00263A007A|nr:hypothetical protein [Algoriphagus sp.]MDG1278580.1 hypothetical protein [Algoriphagus sp.]